MSVKLLRIPTCQRIVLGERVAPGVYGGDGRPRLCGRLSIAVLRYDDGQERFACDEHLEPAPDVGLWRLHRREVAAAPVSRAAVDKRVTPTGRPKRTVSAEARANMAAGQRARWARRERELRMAS